MEKRYETRSGDLFVHVETLRTIAVFILVRNWPDNVEVLMIWVSVGRMSSRHSSRRDVGMGSKAQEVGLELFIICGIAESRLC